MGGSRKKIRVFAPATVSNVACGFDIFGYALNEPGDFVCVVEKHDPGVEITSITGDNGRLPKCTEKNTAGIAAQAFLDHVGSSKGINMVLEKGMPLSSGLGSSAASAVAAVYAVNLLLGEPLERDELLQFVLKGEQMACGSAHADNAAPSLLGGFVMIRSYNPLDIVRVPVPELYTAVIHPDVEIRTEDARNRLSKTVPLEKMIQQCGNAAALISGFYSKDYELISRSLQDVVIEPQRSDLIPGFGKVRQTMLDNGALGCSISGSGPSVFGLFNDREKAMSAAEAACQVFSGIGIGSRIYLSSINEQGPRLIEEDE